MLRQKPALVYFHPQRSVWKYQAAATRNLKAPICVLLMRGDAQKRVKLLFFSTLLLQFFHLMKFQRPEPCRGQGSRLSRVRWRNSDFIK